MAVWLLKTVCAAASSAQREELQMSSDPPAELGVTEEGPQAAFRGSSEAGIRFLPLLLCPPEWSRGTQVLGQLRAPQAAACAFAHEDSVIQMQGSGMGKKKRII